LSYQPQGPDWWKAPDGKWHPPQPRTTEPVTADLSSGAGWWMATDGRWYPPQTAPRPLPPQYVSSPAVFVPRPAKPWSTKRALIITFSIMLALVVGIVVVAEANKAGSTNSANNQYVADVQSNTSTVTSSASYLTKLGHSICGALDAGAPFDAAVSAISVGGSDPNLEATPGIPASANDRSALLFYAVKDLCPAHTAAMNAWVASNP
jgi:hypothetical protein